MTSTPALAAVSKDLGYAAYKPPGARLGVWEIYTLDNLFVRDSEL